MRTFEEAKKLYESITPIRQTNYSNDKYRCRVGPDIRPVVGRYRYSDRIVKVSNDEYTVTSDWYMYGPEVPTWCGDVFTKWSKRKLLEWQRGVSFMRNGEIVVYGNPHVDYNRKTKKYVNKVIRGPHGWTQRDVLNRFLPNSVNLYNLTGKMYLWVHGLSYVVPQEGLRLKEVDGKWVPQNPVQETAVRIDRKKAKEMRKQLDKFRTLLYTYWDLLAGSKFERPVYGHTYQMDRFVNVALGKDGSMMDLVRDIRASYDKANASWYTNKYKSYYGEERECTGNRFTKFYPKDDPEKAKKKIIIAMSRPLLRKHADQFDRVPVPIGTPKRKHWVERPYYG